MKQKTTGRKSREKRSNSRQKRKQQGRAKAMPDRQQVILFIRIEAVDPQFLDLAKR